MGQQKYLKRLGLGISKTDGRHQPTDLSSSKTPKRNTHQEAHTQADRSQGAETNLKSSQGGEGLGGGSVITYEGTTVQMVR